MFDEEEEAKAKHDRVAPPVIFKDIRVDDVASHIYLERMSEAFSFE